jgi:hypothetical protein
MTDNRVEPLAGAFGRASGFVLLTSALLLSACSGKIEAPGSTLRVYAADLAGGARICEVSKVSPAADGVSNTSIKVVNDGGWCGIATHQDGNKPFDAGLLTTRAAHGSVTIHEVGDNTRIDYTPDRGFAGIDAFAVKLIPGNATIRVNVAVTAPAT